MECAFNVIYALVVFESHSFAVLIRLLRSISDTSTARA